MEYIYAVCRVAISPIRAEGSDRSEQVSQLLFGELVMVLQQEERWWRILKVDDKYEGWIDPKQVLLIDEAAYTKYLGYTHLVPPQINNPVTGPDGSTYYLAAGSVLPAFSEGGFNLGSQSFQASFTAHKSLPVSSDHIRELAMFYLNAPYLWGGRTLYGIDCSGFTQIVFRLAGIPILRDAWQQAEQGEVVNFLPEVKTGDLAFFDNAEGRIIHVGIMLGPDKIIHASGRVRIDPIDDEGIYNAELGRYSHKLRIIKRFL